jgi:FAD/FMN-containing dehydrogenase
MPDEWRALNVPVWSPVLSDFQIMKLIKRKLDPGNLFNPGRFMGGL